MNVLIVGAGIAGLNCALQLLRMGKRVTVVEKQRGILDKVCGEGILPFGVQCLRELGMEETARQQGQPFYGIAYHQGGRSVTGSFPDGRWGLGIGRDKLDRLLRAACSSFPGFHLKSGTRFLPTEKNLFDRVIAADGILSRWGRAHGVHYSFGKRLGVRFRIDAPPSDRVEIHFFREGEVYLTPVNPTTRSVAFLLDPNRRRVPGSQLKAFCRGLFRERFPQFDDRSIREVATRGPIASKTRGNPTGLHLLGDACRAFDPISGAGMSFALLCGSLAARYLHDPEGYYRALAPVQKSLDSFTNAILFLRGGGLRTRLMLRQLAKAPASFNRILECHDGHHRFRNLGGRHLLALAKPW